MSDGMGWALGGEGRTSGAGDGLGVAWLMEFRGCG